MTNTDGLIAKDLAELRAIIADPQSRNRDVQAAQQVVADHAKENH